jgi:outer membrane protein assembly factor BamB
VVFIASSDHKLFAFSATGTTNCSGTPVTCASLWTAATGNQIVGSSPAVANKVVYVGSTDGGVYAFSAGGTKSCSGTPKTCQPLWKWVTGGPLYSSPAVANGMVYIASDDGNLYVFHL